MIEAPTSIYTFGFFKDSGSVPLVFWWKWYLKIQDALLPLKPGELDSWFVSLVCRLAGASSFDFNDVVNLRTLAGKKFPAAQLSDRWMIHVEAKDAIAFRRLCLAKGYVFFQLG